MEQSQPSDSASADVAHGPESRKTRVFLEDEGRRKWWKKHQTIYLYDFSPIYQAFQGDLAGLSWAFHY